MRVGQGYDVHRLVRKRPLIIGGVTIPYKKGLSGHSDADVLIHAVMDALLGAAGLCDIGYHFPDNDDRFLGVSSMRMLAEVHDLVVSAGYVVVNIDALVVAQQPKLAPFKTTMAENIAQALQIAKNAVNVKATTEEGLGFTGKGKAIAAHAVCLIMAADTK